MGRLPRTKRFSRSGPKLVPKRKSVAQERDDLLAYWGEHPANWIFGHDPTTTVFRIGREERHFPDGVPLIWTADPKDTTPIKPLPTDLQYLRVLCDLFQSEKFILLDKCRQMILTTLAVQIIHWQCLFRPARRWVLSKIREDDSVEVVQDKLRGPHSRLPEWLQEALPIKPRPAKKVIYPGTDSYILAAAQNVAETAARGGTASGVLCDEGAWQAMFESIVGASLPMCDQFWGITTPCLDNPGGQAYKKRLEQPSDTEATKELQEKYAPPRGLTLRKTVEGIVVATVDYFANPAKDSKAWLHGERRKLGDKRFRIEILHNWDESSGTDMFPEWHTNGGLTRYVHRLEGVPKGYPVVRGWDSGWRKPVCVWMVYVPTSSGLWKLWILREWCPLGVSTYTLADVALHLSGQKKLDDLDMDSRREVAAIATDRTLPPPPWFSPDVRWDWQDYGGPEFNKVSADVSNETAERTAASILASRRIYIALNRVTPKARCDLFHKLLAIQDDGFPGVLIDPSCKKLIGALSGGLVLADPTKEKPFPDEPKANDFLDVFDAVGYAATQVVPLVDPPRQERGVQAWYDRRPLTPEEMDAEQHVEQETIGWYELRRAHR